MKLHGLQGPIAVEKKWRQGITKYRFRTKNVSLKHSKYASFVAI